MTKIEELVAEKQHLEGVVVRCGHKLNKKLNPDMPYMARDIYNKIVNRATERIEAIVKELYMLEKICDK